MKRENFKRSLVILTALLMIFASPVSSVFASPVNPPVTSPTTNVQDSPSTNQPGSGVQRIRFAPGTTSAVVSGDLLAHDRDRYRLRALAGQLMDVSLSAPQDVRLSVMDEGGRALSASINSSTSFRGYLPTNGRYVLEVTSGSQPTSYALTVSIPQRVSFQRGATSASMRGHVAAHQSHDYILRAGAGQFMEINITPDRTQQSLQLILYGADGTVLKSGMGEGLSFRGELPASQDYIVTVRAAGQDVSYTLDVTIPQRISFQPGAVSASVKGRLSAHSSQYYVLRAMKNQTMQVEVLSDNNVQLVIYGADGSVLKSGMGEGTNNANVLPSTQDYILVVRSGPNPSVYSLYVEIR